MDNIKDIVADRLQRAMDNKQFSQTALADKSQVSKSTINKAINKGGLSVNMAKLISKALNVSLDYLYGNDEIESLPQYALDTMTKHISAYNCKSSWGSDALISTISISQPFSEYLEAIFEAGKTKMPEHVRKSWLQEEKERFLQVIDEDTKDKVEFALIKRVFLTDLVS